MFVVLYIDPSSKRVEYVRGTFDSREEAEEWLRAGSRQAMEVADPQPNMWFTEIKKVDPR